jgi:hypothetical protein
MHAAKLSDVKNAAFGNERTAAIVNAAMGVCSISQ